MSKLKLLIHKLGFTGILHACPMPQIREDKKSVDEKKNFKQQPCSNEHRAENMRIFCP